ncbi:hypothetical protein PoB_006534600 [Plakobranchus ocellatus]|uniref:Uncharacterized protein n=1 Tax=Plakobranchus ocellatus TaxID=259542 RepID=A0AAV4D433_9GAST|nr:hypothetical protein PoB_006534600 [Plakobranchus ocellatus]
MSETDVGVGVDTDNSKRGQGASCYASPALLTALARFQTHWFGFGFLCIASPQQSDLKLLGPPSGKGAGGEARARDRRIPADIRADSLATAPPTPLPSSL